MTQKFVLVVQKANLILGCTKNADMSEGVQRRAMNMLEVWSTSPMKPD